MDINWTNIASFVLSSAFLVGGFLMGILGLYIDAKISKQKEAILKHIDDTFARKDAINLQFESVKEKLTDIKSELKKGDNNVR